MYKKLIPVVFFVWALFSVHMPLHAQKLASPSAKTVLTIGGKLGQTNGQGLARLDMVMLNALPQRTIKTRTPWYAGVTEFTGPTLADVLMLVEASGTSLRATALNDYSIVIPVSDAADHQVVLATLLNGKTMSVRDKGPIFLIYPFDSKEQLRASTFYERSIWQLKSLELE